jgi:multidrug resistance efflux pump
MLKLNMRNLVLGTVLLMAGAWPAFAASEADYKAAFAAAETAEKQADQLRNKWTTTEAQLAAAKKAAASGDFDAATAAATEAESLAKASIFQATSERERWKDMEIR